MTKFYGGGDWIDNLPKSAQVKIRERMIMHTLQEGEYLHHADSESAGLYQVLSGFVKLTSSVTNGNELIVTIYGSGCCLGEIPLLEDGRHRFNAVALGKVEVAILPKNYFDELAALYPQMYHCLTSKLCGLITYLLREIHDTALLTLGQRLAKLILSAAKTYGKTFQDQVVIEIPITQTDLGKMLGVTRHSIMREVKQWKSHGIIDKESGRWIIKDTSKIKGLAKSTG